jgi:hypothetical protein
MNSRDAIHGVFEGLYRVGQLIKNITQSIDPSVLQSLNPSIVQYAFQPKLGNGNEVVFRDAFGDEDKFFVIDLPFDVVTDPVFTVQMKHGRIDAFDDDKSLGFNPGKHVAQSRRFLWFVFRFSIGLGTVPFGGHKYIIERNVIPVEQVYPPVKVANGVFFAGYGYLNPFYRQKRNVFLHGMKSSLIFWMVQEPNISAQVKIQQVPSRY